MQNDTTTKTLTVTEPYKKYEFERWIEWKALGGILIDDEVGRVEKMSLTQFRERYNVAKSTVNLWKTVPDLTAKLEKRREEVVSISRVSAVWNANFILAIQTQDKRAAVEAQKIFLGHFGNLKIPTQRQEIEHKFNAADLLVAAKSDGIIEGEVVHGPDDHTSPNGENPSTLSATS